MPETYGLQEARFIQDLWAQSVANGLWIALLPVPENKYWTILSAVGYPDAAETQDYWFAILRGSTHHAITNPTEFALDPAVQKYCPLEREGMEVNIYPGEMLTFHRDAALAGSTLIIKVRMIESDLPLYEYIEPQERKRLDQARSSVIRQFGGGAPARSGTLPTRMGPPVGPRGRGV